MWLNDTVKQTGQELWGHLWGKFQILIVSEVETRKNVCELLQLLGDFVFQTPYRPSHGRPLRNFRPPVPVGYCPSK